MKKLMIFGDSIIKGVTYSGQSYHLCQDHDFDSIAAQGVTVENYARMGATIDAGLKQIDRRLAPCAEDTTVLFCFGGNDCGCGGNGLGIFNNNGDGNCACNWIWIILLLSCFGGNGCGCGC